MLDLGWGEILLLCALALVVLGPQRLPEAARFVGRQIGRARRFTEQVRTELATDEALEELRAAGEQWAGAAREIHQKTALPPWERLPEMRTPEDFVPYVTLQQRKNESLYCRSLRQKRRARQPRRRALH